MNLFHFQFDINRNHTREASVSEKYQFSYYVNENKFAEAEKMMASNIIFAKEDYQKLIARCSIDGKLENALNVLKRVQANDASFRCYVGTLVSIVKEMIEKDYDFDEIEALLFANRMMVLKIFHNDFDEVLGRLVHNGQMELFQKLYDVLVKYNHIKAKV